MCWKKGKSQRPVQGLRGFRGILTPWRGSILDWCRVFSRLPAIAGTLWGQNGPKMALFQSPAVFSGYGRTMCSFWPKMGIGWVGPTAQSKSG